MNKKLINRGLLQFLVVINKFASPSKPKRKRKIIVNFNFITILWSWGWMSRVDTRFYVWRTEYKISNLMQNFFPFLVCIHHNQVVRLLVIATWLTQTVSLIRQKSQFSSFNILPLKSIKRLIFILWILIYIDSWCWTDKLGERQAIQ